MVVMKEMNRITSESRQEAEVEDKIEVEAEGMVVLSKRSFRRKIARVQNEEG